MSIVSKPNTFSASTTISSSKVNANFDTLYNDYNGSISAANLATDSVTTAKIADDNVTAAKIADGAIDAAAKIADAIVTSEKLNATIAVRAYRTAAKNITSSGVKIDWDTENYDLGSDFDTGTGTFTAPVTGYYFVSACVAVSNLDAEGQVYAEIYVNGTVYSRGSRVYAGGTGDTKDPAAVVTDIVPVTAAQTIEIYGTTSTTEALQTGSVASYVSIYFVGV